MHAIRTKELGSLYRLQSKALKALTLPLFLRAHLLAPEIGREHGLGAREKLALFRKIVRNHKRIESATSWHEQVILAGAVLRIPKSRPGIVVECGCFKGSSTSTLSLACELTGRRLHVFDSFAGLPEPTEEDKKHLLPHAGELHTYEEGAFRGALDEVRENVRRNGALEVCTFVEGFFDKTMPSFAAAGGDPVVLAFCDVDLRSSLEDCIAGLWPRMSRGAALFTHEAHHMEIPALFFDVAWWRERLGTAAPGLIGAGCGISFGVGYDTGLGYALKDPAEGDLEHVPQVLGLAHGGS